MPDSVPKFTVLDAQANTPEVNLPKEFDPDTPFARRLLYCVVGASGILATEQVWRWARDGHISRPDMEDCTVALVASIVMALVVHMIALRHRS